MDWILRNHEQRACEATGKKRKKKEKKKKKKEKKKLARIFCLDIAAKDHWATIARSITWNYASMAIDLGVEVKQPRS